MLLLVVDSLRADAVLSDRELKKSFARLAERGIVFEQCVSTATATTPSFASLLTGCYPPKHGLRTLRGCKLNMVLPTLPGLFRQAGYETHAEVTGPVVEKTGLLRDFDTAHYRGPRFSDLFTGRRDEILRRMEAFRQPWFMLLHTWEVHSPYRSGPSDKGWDRGGYEAAVSATEEWLEPVFASVDLNSIVVITGDHGEVVPDKSWKRHLARVATRARKTIRAHEWLPVLDRALAAREAGHGFAIYEPLVRVPLIITGPEISAGKVATQVRHVDLFPTLADYCHMAVQGVDGRSLRPLMEGHSLPEDPAYIEAGGVGRPSRSSRACGHPAGSSYLLPAARHSTSWTG